MHVLHLCNDYLGTSAHISLYSELDRIGIRQTIYVPVYSSPDTTKRNIVFKTNGSVVVFSEPLKNYHKLLYGCKIKVLTNDIIDKINLSEIDIIHSTVMCNGGAIAYELYIRFNIPFITAVRNTDLNGYIKLFRWRLPYFRKIADAASNIIFISSQYPSRMIETFGWRNNRSVLEKFLVIHNGLDCFYLNNRHHHERRLNEPIRIVFAGAFVPNKNIHGLIEAAKLLIDKGFNIQLSAIGNNLASYTPDIVYANKIKEKEKLYKWFKSYPAQDKRELMISLREADVFALLSFQETFGLSYLEALSQGIPVIYTKGEGFDGTYPEGTVGYGALAKDPYSIAEAIIKAIENYDRLIDNISNLDMREYNWEFIANRYKSLYQKHILKG